MIGNRLVRVGSVHLRAAVTVSGLCGLITSIVPAPCSVCHAADGNAPAPRLTASIAEQLASVVDITLPELADFSRLVAAGDDAAAMRRIVALLAKRCAALPPQRAYGWWLHAPADADALLGGDLTTARYGDPSTRYTVAIGPPGAIDFFKAAPDYRLTIRDISTMHWVNKHAEAYAKTRDPKYLRAWCATWADFTAHWDAQFAAVQRDPGIWDRGADGHQRVHGIGWVTNTLYVGWRLQAMREGLVGLLQSAAAAGQLDQIDSNAIGGLLVRIATREGPQARALLRRAETTTPNQARSMAMELFRIGCLLPFLEDATAWRSEPIDVLFLTNLPDGTDREQSLNYFVNQFRELPASIRRDIPEDRQDPSVLVRIETASEYRDRVLPSIARPDGFPPATGTSPVWSQYGRARKLSPPSRAFTSILFPYGGYAVQRDGWTPESRYLFMKVCRPSAGHWRSQDGGLQLAALGRNLLVSPIGEVYDARDEAGGWRLYWDSGVSQNTIVVDGMAAVERKGDFRALDPLRWHTGAIDFMETEIRGPYKGPDFRVDGSAYAARRLRGEAPDKSQQGPAVTDVVHRRQVHFLRAAGCWLVTDRITSGLPHDFTQSWCFGPEYAHAEVVVEPAGGHGGRIATVKPGDPNLAIFQSGPAGLVYEKHAGVYEADRILGWVGILADRERWTYTPAVNVHATWRSTGGELLLTLLVPHEGVASGVTIDAVVDDEPRGIRGLDATLADGGRIACRVARSPEEVEALGVQAWCSSLVVARAADGRIAGVALDTGRFADRRDVAADFEFSMPTAGAPAEIQPIGCPTGFHWAGSSGDARPSYAPAP